MTTLAQHLQNNSDKIDAPISGVFNRRSDITILSVHIPEIERDYDGLEKYRSGYAVCLIEGKQKKIPISMITIR